LGRDLRLIINEIEMVDIRKIVEDTDNVRTLLHKRLKPDELDLDNLIAAYEKYKEALVRYENARADQKRKSEDLSRTKKGSDEFTKAVTGLKVMSESVRKVESEMTELKEEYLKLLDGVPNFPDDDVPAGGREANKVLREVGNVPQFDFEIKDHLTLGTDLGILDFDRAAKIAGTQFAMHVGDGALLVWALVTYFIQKHVKDGYTPYLPPHLLNRESAYVAGQLPKFEEDVYWTADGMCLLPTAETALANLHRDEILEEKDLPRKFFAYTPCYRKESGAAGTRDRGLMRMHQFHKVEMFQYTRPEDSDAALKELVGKAEALVKDLGLAYRVTLLAGEDMSFGMAKTVDIEVWLPFEKKWAEVSSASNARDFQARRGNIRYRKADGSIAYVNMLNASGLATSRLTVAILETYQNTDGSVRVPDVLQTFLGKKVITAPR